MSSNGPSEHGVSVLQQWRQKQSLRAETIPCQAQEDQPLPLSFAQGRIWFLQQLTPESPSYHLPLAFRLLGRIQVAVFEQSLTEVVKRHTILRTTFSEVNGSPVQIIHAARPQSCMQLDLRSFDASIRTERLNMLIETAYQQPFDLAQGPLFRTTLFTIKDDEHLLLITIHHLITDGWSNGILMEELGEIYTALSTGRTPILNALPVTYADLALWHRVQFEQGAFAQDLAYWQEQLNNAPTLLQLPLDYPRPAIPTSQGATLHFQIAEQMLSDLRAFCRLQHVTLVTVLQAAFNVFLYRYSGQEDIVLGLPVFNRQRREAEPLIGLFVNTLVMRTSLAGNPDFRTLLERVRASTVAAYAHQAYPFEKLVEMLKPERDTSHTPLFQVMLSIGAGADRLMEWPGLTVLPIEIERTSAAFDLTLEVAEQSHALQCNFIYRSDLFDTGTIERMQRHFCQLLIACISQPETAVSRLPLLSPYEYQQTVSDWNATQVSYARPHFLHKLFEEMVVQTPDANALLFAELHLSYYQLNLRANQLAHFLRTHGVGPEILVGIAVERSLEMVIGLLAILKAGGAYVPLDPSYPAERLAYILQDAHVSLLLTQEQLATQFDNATCAIVCLDRDWPMISTYSVEVPAFVSDPAHLAYAIYTSGSTGKPKGTLNTHRAICNRLLWMQSHFQLRACDRILQKTPFSFDVSLWEFFWPLITGAQLVIARPEGHRDAAYLVEIIQQHNISIIHFVPSMLQVFLEEPGVEHCTTLREVICSGEVLSQTLQERFYAYNQATLTNLYGPTEAAVDVSIWECERSTTRQHVPIGFPIANTSLYILDQQRQPVPIGVAGELHIGGIQVGRGYLNRPELTAEKFMSDPFSSEPGARLYRTGDLARYLPHGTIEYLGRIDLQVKLRGLRIELGEIEAVLVQHPTVREAVVVIKAFVPGDFRIVAYLLLDTDQAFDSVALQRFVGTQLPDYMVPHSFVLLDALPLSPSGKVDRQQLPDPAIQNQYTLTAYVAPGNEIERILAEIWQELLQVPRVGRQHNFFELGGHSLLVTQMRSKIKERLHIDIAIIDAFRFTTVQSLAQHLSQHQHTETWSAQNSQQRALRQRQALKRRQQ